MGKVPGIFQRVLSTHSGVLDGTKLAALKMEPGER